jgi:cystathionine gamma-synthase
MVAFRPAGGVAAAERLTAATRVFTLAESLGGVESLIELPGVMTHASVVGTDAEVPADLIRLSVGLEHPDDLVADLDQALAAAGRG